MSRLITLATTATLAAGIVAAEMQTPGIAWTTALVIGHGAKLLLVSGYWAVVVIAAATFIGYVLCLIKNAPAITAARIERRHEHRIIALRKHNADLSAQLRAEARWNS